MRSSKTDQGPRLPGRRASSSSATVTIASTDAAALPSPKMLALVTALARRSAAIERRRSVGLADWLIVVFIGGTGLALMLAREILGVG